MLLRENAHCSHLFIVYLTVPSVSESVQCCVIDTSNEEIGKNVNGSRHDLI